MKAPEDFNFLAGQFITFIFEHEGKRYPRSYSILSTPSSKELKFCIKFLEGGIASQQFKIADENTIFNCIGPLGPFVFDEQTTNKHCFIATDTGIAPIKSMIDEFTGKKMHLIFGARTLQDLYYHNEFLELAKQDWFTYSPTLSREEVQDIPKGYVQKLLTQDTANTTFYICGNKKMVLETIELLKEKGVDEQLIRYERFS